MASCPINPASENIADFIYRYGNYRPLPIAQEDILCADFITLDYTIIYTPLENAAPVSLGRYSYYSIPGIFTLLDSGGLEASGISAVFNTPSLANRGKGVLIGIIDTGIDYTNPLFLYPDGTTRISAIWDQSLPEDRSAPAPGVPDYSAASGASYGTEFTRAQINEALASDSPFSLVPTKDTNGHGTFLAAIAAGNALPEQDFSGAAPDAELVVVKLKQAKAYLREFYQIPQDAEAFQENDIMMAVKYMRVASYLQGKPLVILLGLGTNLGSHEASSPLCQVLQDISRTLGMATVIAAGNETGLSHHFLGSIGADQEWEDVEIHVGPKESQRGFVLELWSAAADTFSVGFLSPSGERIGRLPILEENETHITFLLEPTVITVNILPIETGSGRQLIFMRFQNPTAGVWKVRIYPAQYFLGSYNLWLPAQGLISDETVFLRPSPYITITEPGNTPGPITVSACSHTSSSIYIHSSRGFTASGFIKPDLAAPGVDILGPSASRRPEPGVPLTRRTGTSLAAAQAAGAAANLLSWAIVEGNDVTMSEAALKSHLIRGADRNPSLIYPNEEWGYGTLNLFQAFLPMRE